MRIDSRIRSTKFVPSNVRLDVQKQYKITFIKPRELPICIYMMDEQFLRKPEVSKLIKELRGGSWTTPLIGNVICMALLYTLWIIGTESFGLGPVLNRNWGEYGSAPSSTGSRLEITRPSAMPHQDFVALTKEERRQLPHPNNME